MSTQVSEMQIAQYQPANLLREKLHERNIDLMARRLLGHVVYSMCGTTLAIRQVTTVEEYEAVKESRLRMYWERGGYFDKLIEKDGSDVNDHRSYIFSAHYQGRIVGSIRLTPYPFEVCKYVEPARLAEFLGVNFHDRFLEVSRLVIERRLAVKHVARALTIYAGFLTSLLTNYTRYVAAARPKVKRKSFPFRIATHNLPLFMKERGEHDYELMKGSFIADFHQIMSGKWHLMDAVVSAAEDRDEESY